MPNNAGRKGFGKISNMCPIASRGLKNGLGSRYVGKVLSKHLADRFTVYLSEVLQRRDS